MQTAISSLFYKRIKILHTNICICIYDVDLRDNSLTQKETVFCTSYSQLICTNICVPNLREHSALPNSIQPFQSLIYKLLLRVKTPSFSKKLHKSSGLHYHLLNHLFWIVKWKMLDL